MSKSRKHLKRRNTSKKKTFKIEFKEMILTIKAMDSRSALRKAYRSRIQHHHNQIISVNSIVNSLKKLIKKITPQTKNQKESLNYNEKRLKKLEDNYPFIDEFKLVW